MSAEILCWHDDLKQTREPIVDKQHYQPIACGLHEQYQLAAMRGALLELSWKTESGGQMSARLRILDVATRNGAEFLTAETSGGDRHEIRLDWITRAAWAESGIALDPQA